MLAVTHITLRPSHLSTQNKFEDPDREQAKQLRHSVAGFIVFFLLFLRLLQPEMRFRHVHMRPEATVDGHKPRTCLQKNRFESNLDKRF